MAIFLPGSCETFSSLLRFFPESAISRNLELIILPGLEIASLYAFKIWRSGTFFGLSRSLAHNEVKLVDTTIHSNSPHVSTRYLLEVENRITFHVYELF